MSNIDHIQLIPLRLVGHERSNGHALWEYRCRCGNIKTIRKSHVDLGHTKSCGCLVHRKKPDSEFRGRYRGNSQHRLHRQIAISNYGEIPKGFVVHHIDGNKLNNTPDNLAVITQKEHIRIHNGWKQIEGVWHKTCTAGCERLLPAIPTYFYLRSNGTLVSACKTCRAEYQKRKKEGEEDASSEASSWDDECTCPAQAPHAPPENPIILPPPKQKGKP